MPTKDRKAALGNSMKAEEEAIRTRFERAETVLASNDVSSLAERETAPSPPPHRNGVREEEPRVKRDSFTMPVTDYELIAALQTRCLQAKTRANKSEILRAGLIALSALSDDDLAALVEDLPKVKTGRRPVNLV